MALTSQHKISLKKSSPQELAGYINEGRFSDNDLADLAAGNPDFAKKLAEAKALVDQMPSPQENQEFERLRLAMQSAVDAPETAAALAEYLDRWGARANAVEHVAQAKEFRRRLDERAAFHALNAKVQEALDAHAATGRMPSRDTVSALNNYMQTWSGCGFAGEDVAEVRKWAASLKAVFGQVVVQKWNSILDADGKLKDISLVTDLFRLPIDENMRAKADDLAWEWVQSGQDVLAAAERYDNIFGHRGRHSGEVARLRECADEWNMYANSNIYSVIAFLESHPDHPFAAVAGRRIQELKAEALESMRANPALIPVTEFKMMLESPYFTREELMDAAGLDEEMMRRNVEDFDNLRMSLPDEPSGETVYGGGLGEQGLTDIVFFGITSSGKTCVLSGLLRHDKLWFDNKNFSGDYGNILRAYAEKGFALSGTAENFVATIKAEVSRLDDNYRYQFNLFEMAGEAFRRKIANARDTYGHTVTSFADMGKGAPEILSTDNDKVFFILIDPTTSYVQLREQTEAVRALITLMFGKVNGYNPNHEIMNRVRGLHFIVTKADTLPAGNLQENARKMVHRVLNEAERDILIEGCREYGINPSKDPDLNGRPRVFPYSLGHFTVGNMFRYNPEGASTILRVICDYCSPERKAGVGYKIRSFFTNPII